MTSQPARRSRPIPVSGTRTCECLVSRHPNASQINDELRRLDTPEAGGDRMARIAERHGISPHSLSIHRRKHLGLRALYEGVERLGREVPTISLEVERKLAKRPPEPVKRGKTKPRSSPSAPSQASIHAQLVKTIATLIQIGSYRGDSTIRALAMRHEVTEAEVRRAHRRAGLSVRDGRGGLREQLELSVGVLSSIRDEERRVAEEYTGIADRLIEEHLPDPRRKRGPPTLATQDRLDRARIARTIAAQAQDNAISAQTAIDRNTIHRKTAQIVQIGFSANPDFGKAQDALVMVLESIFGDRFGDLRGRIERGLAIFEDGGESLDGPEFLEHLAELRADADALETIGEST